MFVAQESGTLQAGWTQNMQYHSKFPQFLVLLRRKSLAASRHRLLLGFSARTDCTGRTFAGVTTGKTVHAQHLPDAEQAIRDAQSVSAIAAFVRARLATVAEVKVGGAIFLGDIVLGRAVVVEGRRRV